MSKALDAIKNAHLISVDYDGVLLQLIFNKPWNSEPKAINPLFPSDWFITHFYRRIRKSMPGAGDAIKDIHAMNKRMVVLTARNPLTSVLAKKWLRAEGMDKYFDGFYNSNFIEPASEFKESIIKRLSIDVHIDDSVNVIRHLSLAFPAKTFIWLSSKTTDMKTLGFGTNVFHIKKWEELFKHD